MKGHGFNDAERICGLESRFRLKFTVAEDRELEKLEGGGRRRRSSQIGAGHRRVYRNTSRFLISPCRAYVSEEAEDYAVKMSRIYRVFERHGDLNGGRGNADKRGGSGLWNWGKVDNQGPERYRKANSAGFCESIEERALWIFEDDDDDDSNQIDENESEDQEMTLDEYERALKEKKQALHALLLELAAGGSNDDAEGNNDDAEGNGDDEFEIIEATAVGDL